MFRENLADSLSGLLLFLFLLLSLRGEIEMQWNKEVFQPEPARADIAIGRQAV
jgi:hypothetical protein